MQTQKIIQAGNSQAVVIPKALADELGFRVGHRVVLEKKSDGTGLTIKRADKGVKRVSKKASDAEFQEWQEVFMAENGEILDELAHR